eukprot:160660_1
MLQTVTIVGLFTGGQLAMVRMKDKKQKKEEEKYIEPLPKATKDEKWSSLPGQLRASRHILETYTSVTLPKHKLIPQNVIENAKAIICLTVYKAGTILAYNTGYGIIITRNKQQWSYPVSLHINALTGGAFSGGSWRTKQYLFIINSENVIEQFIKNKKLKLDNIKPGPTGGRNIDISIYPNGDILSYPDTRLNGKTISYTLKANETFYDLKDVCINDILFQNDMVKMEKNNYYDEIIDLLNTYVLDENMERQIDIEKIIQMHDKNIENTVELLKTIYTDIDKDVIRVIFKKQCNLNIENTMDILSGMSKCDFNRENVNKLVVEDS